ncbi:hypothetical protein [Pedobacter sp. L105]|uniref:hypothetical protein n=1 Tax=Pedobacter sp. L105 TaxID=1641871 RepID=UPI00131D413F|nr:hypothetical protein [Pedobacter sp. L105]
MKKFILLRIPIFIYSCTSNSVYINRESDNKQGKILLNKFYKKIANKKFETVDSMVGDSIKQLSGANGISKTVKFINNKVGNYKSYTIDDHYTRCVTGDNNQISYNYKLKVTYDKGIIDEIIGFKKQNGSEIKVNSYHANSDLLIH